jgi:nucleotide-binding universal stress UspA family protein
MGGRRGQPSFLVEDVLLVTGRPILIIPYVGHFETLGTSVLIGWNDSREAVRAVNDTMPVLVKAASVTILEAHPARRRSDANDTTADIARHLARHGIDATTAHTVITGISVADTLLAYATDLGADLLVAAGYGHSRLWESILGGATQGLLQHITPPVLMSHQQNTFGHHAGAFTGGSGHGADRLLHGA